MTKQFEVVENPSYRAVLDKGFVGLVDHMGSDSAIVQAARVSYGKGTKSVNEDRGLIRYLLRHRHTTPFEMCELKFHARAPIIALRQWIRHRTANVNEESARYSEMTDEFYVPDLSVIQPQSKDNKQGRAGEFTLEQRIGYRDAIEASYEASYETYTNLLGSDEDPGLARELARTVMPVGSYSEFYWKIDLWNLMHFLKLRADSHAQLEIRVYAQAMFEIASPLFPNAFEAFDDYIRNALTLSRMERELVKELLTSVVPPSEKLEQLVRETNGEKEFARTRGMSLREFREFRGEFGI